MELATINSSGHITDIVDNYSSLIWTQRYYEAGDFELVAPVTQKTSSIVPGSKLIRLGLLDAQQSIMIAQSVTRTEDLEEGPKLTITGRDLKDVLRQRVLYYARLIEDEQTTEKFYTIINDLVTRNLSSSADETARQISGLTVKNYTSGDPIFDIVVDAFSIGKGANLYETVLDYCLLKSVGFDVLASSSDFNVWQFKLYSGVDRSSTQSVVPPVIFSPEFANLSSSTFVDDITDYATHTLICGEDDENEPEGRIWIEEAASGSVKTGLNRREIFTDASGKSATVDGWEVDDDEYLTIIKTEGQTDLKKHQSVSAFDGEVLHNGQFKIGVDYNIGDIVTVADSSGNATRARITEYIRSMDGDGYKEYPTFEKIEET
ncbi:MAG TPA: siphovirus ReqiPepy6 Gp37-like family protein [Candidatus Saccharibacteria bacterium]|nr:siphovirus ReqiPepy6 Gp37-like family protein [Candidatus Saccharibacteria bacterium]